MVTKLTTLNPKHLVGADLIHNPQTYQVSVLAKEAKKPFYVAAESYKFCRLYPLSPTDLPKAESEAAPKHVDGSAVRSIPSDFTPPDKVREQERNQAKLFSIPKE